MEARRQDLMTSIGLLILRLGVAGYMLTHGGGKLPMLLNGAEFAAPIGLGGRTSLVLVVVAEFGCALLVMLGLGTRLAALPVVFAMGVAAFVAHGNDPWTQEAAVKLFFSGATKYPASKQPALLYLIPFLALAFTGPGRFSFDALIWPRLRRRKAVASEAA